MKKRILSIVLSIVMLVSLLPTTALALPAPEAPHTHPVCGKTHTDIGDHTGECGDITWTAWTSTTSLPNTAGNYYLTANVTINNTWSPKDGTVLCLNGKTITKNNSDSYNNSHAISIGASVTFTLTDCQSAAGTITHRDENYKGCGVELCGSAAVFNMYGGAISGNTNAYYGGGVEIESGIFNMYGGTISNNTANYGGGVYVNKNQEFNMYGGTISSNTASHNGGGGVYVSISTFNMYGGTISSNNATNTSTTANVGCGGGVYISGDSGSAVVNMTGGTISGNTSANYGGGVYVYSSSTFNVSGSPVITGNTTSTDTNADNVYLKSLKKVTLTGALSAEAQIGVTLERTTSAFTANWNTYMPDVTNYEEYFSSDNSAYGIIKNGNDLYLQTIVAVTGVTLNKSSATLEVNGTEMLTATVKPNNATNKTVSWSSSDPTVAKVENGVVTALKPGSTTITVTTTDGGKTATCAVTVSAPAPAHSHYNCGVESCNADHNGDATGNGHSTVDSWTAWDGGDTNLTSGSYYLTDDVTLTETLTISSGTVNLCLNGHVLKYDGTDKVSVIKVASNATLSICDCTNTTHTGYINSDGLWEAGTPSGEEAAVTLTGGIITGGTGYRFYDDTSYYRYGGGIYVDGGTLNLYGGNIAGNLCEHEGDLKKYGGGGVYVKNGTFNMYDGTITGNCAMTKTNGGGGGLYLDNSTFNMSGGKISQNKAHLVSGSYGGYGGGIYVFGSNSQANLSGTAEISGNSAYSAGGGINLATGSITMSGNVAIDGNEAQNGGGVSFKGNTFTINGGSISNNTATGSYGAGGVEMTSGSITMNDGSISNNTAAGTGGGVRVYDGTFTMAGGSISGNKTTGSAHGGGVYIYNNGSATFAMTAGKISGNTASGNGGGVYNDRVFQISGGEISGNIASVDGGGVYANKAAKLSGAPTISGNTVNENSNNVSVSTSVNIAVVGELTNTTPIGVTVRSSGTGKFASPSSDVATLANGYADKFQSDNPAYAVAVEDTYLILAEAPHSHPVCGATCAHDGTHSTAENWTELTASDLSNGTLSLTDGKSYYLGEDITVTKTVAISGEVNLCLNGKTITGTSTAAIQVYSGAVLNICDCSTDGTVGKIENTNNNSTGSGTTTYGIYNSGTVNVYGGTISATTAATTTTAGSGSGIYNYGGEVTVVGTGAVVSGTYYGIYNNSTNGTVSVSDGKVSGKYGIYNKGEVIVGGEIEVTGTDYGISTSGTVSVTGGTVQATSSSGHGIYSTSGTVSVSGGTVQATGSNGRGIYNSGGAVSVTGGSVSGLTYGVYASSTGDITISGGEVSARNSASNSNSYGVYRLGSGAVEITGGTVSGKNGVYLYGSGNVTVSGGTVTGNGSGIYGYGIYLHSSSTGAVSVSGGTVSGTAYGVYTTGNSSGSVTVSGVANISGAQSGILHYGKGTVTVSGGTVKSPQRVTGTTSSGIKILTGSGNVTVSGGTVSGMDYGIYNGGTLTLSNAPTITGDTADIHLDSGKIITISGALTYTEENAISVKMDSAGTFTSGWKIKMGGNAANYGSYFTSADNTYTVQPDGSGELKLAEPTLTGVSAVGYSGQYDGNAHGITVNAPSDATVKYGTTEGVYTADASPTYTDAGSFTVYYQVTKDGYSAVAGSAQVSISKAPLTVTANDKTIIYGAAPANDGVSYSGFVNGETANVLGGTLAYDYSYTQYGNVGSHTITPKGLTAVNYAITFTPGTLTVQPKEIGISWTKTTLTYNGSAQKPTATATGVVNNDEVTLTVSGEQTNVGTHTATVSAISNSNYKLPDAKATSFTISAKSLTNPTIELSKDSFTYDGGEKKPTVVTVKDGENTLASGVDYDITWPTDCTSVGTKTITVTFKGNYSGNKTVEYAIVAADSSCTAPVAVDNLVYTGSAQNLVTAATPTGGTVQYSLSETGTFSESIPTGTDAGTYNVYYKVIGDANHNDTAVLGPVQVKIAKQKVTMPTENTATFTYTGTAQTYMETASTLYEISNETQTNAGSYTVIVALKDSANYEWADGSTDDLTFTFTIAPKAVTVKADAKSMVYGASEPALTYVATGLVAGETLNGEITRAAGTDVGTYAITQGTVTDENNPNYTITFVSADFTITKADASCIAPVAVADLVYTGSAQTLVTAATPTGGTVQYSLSATGTFSDRIPTGTDAGTYDVYYKVIGDVNHNDTAVLGPVQVAISKANQAAPVVGKVDETIFGKDDGKITGVTSAMEYRKDGTNTYTDIVGVDIAGLADGTYYVRLKGDSNHNPSADTAVVIGAGRMLTVTVPQNQVGYTMITTTPEVEYFGSIRVEFKLHDGYSMTDSFQICNGTDPVGFSLMGDTYVYGLNFVNSDFNFTVSGVADITAPLAQIDIKNNKWTSFWNGVTFGLFFNETQDVTVTAADTGSGMNSIQYYLAGGELELDEVKQIPVWQDYSSTFQIDPDNAYVVYVKVTDNAGNVSYLNSDGVVLDQTVPVLVGIENNGSYYGDQCFKALDDYLDALKVDGVDVTDEMNADNEYTIVADNAEHIVTATDKAGNATEYKITVFKNYTVTYKVDGNTVSTQTVGHGKDATAPTIPEKEGYTQTAPVWDKDGTNITADTEINAVYTINKYTVTYKADGQVVDTQTIEHGANATPPTVPAKEGYTQTAPAWDKDGKNITVDTEINAVYTINKYTVTYVADGETISTQTIEHGADATAPAIPAKEGYTQVAPYWDGDGKNITTNTTITAVYTINKYTVTYKADGQVVDTQTIEHGANATPPTVPAKEGYTQIAPVWDKDGKNITVDTEINAVYTINKYTVTYVADGETISTQTIEHGADATAPAVPAKEGYTQVAPYWDKDGKNITTDTEINAVYTINKYNVTFNSNGGNKVDGIPDVIHGTVITAPTAPTKENATFAGWFSDSACTKAWNFDTDTVTADLTLYAKWSDVPVFHISGKVLEETDNENEKVTVSGATVELKLGTTLIATETTDENGLFYFGGQKAGDYNVVVTSGDKVVTVLVTLHDHDEDGLTVELPKTVTNSIVEHEPAADGKDSVAAGTLVGGLEDVAAAVRSENQSAQKVEVKLTVKDTPPVTGTPTAGTEAAKQQAQQKAIQQKAGGKQLAFFDLSVVKTINGGTPVAITDTGDTLLEIRIPFDSGNKWGITIYRYHGDKAEVLAAVREGSTTEGFWVGDDGYIHIYTHKFSTYAVGYTVPSYGYFVPVTPDTVTSADTFDAGIVVYVTMSMLAATGSAVVIGKKRKEEN